MTTTRTSTVNIFFPIPFIPGTQQNADTPYVSLPEINPKDETSFVNTVNLEQEDQSTTGFQKIHQ